MSRKVVCLCGSTKFYEEFRRANYRETLSGKIVLMPGVYGHSGDVVEDHQKQDLDFLHKEKILMSSQILVINPNGYVGESTLGEIRYAKACKIPIRFLYDMDIFVVRGVEHSLQSLSAELDKQFPNRIHDTIEKCIGELVANGVNFKYTRYNGEGE